MNKKQKQVLIAILLIGIALIIISLLMAGNFFAIVTETYVKFRTGSLTYDDSSLCDGSKVWIAYSGSCGSSLSSYGSYPGGSNSGSNCNSLGSFLFNVPYQPGTPRVSCEINSDGDRIAKLYDCSSQYSGNLCVCENDVDGSGYSFVRFRPNYGNAVNAITSLIPTGTNELTCQITVCTPEWQCTAWSSCISNQQTRTCTDIYNCGTLEGKPAETQSCTSCTPTTCTILGKSCGSWSDGCGGSLDCGSCQSGYSCDNGNCVLILPTYVCGNSVLESGEICDGTSLAGKICEDFSLISGELRCKSNCQEYDLSLCQSSPPATCTPNWQTGVWSSCNNGIQTRTVTDSNNCGLLTGKPLDSQTCIEEIIPIEPISSIPTTSEELECTSGERCIGTHYYLCENNEWTDKGEIIGKCNYIHLCEENMKKCVGNTVYICNNAELKLDKICEGGICKEGECEKQRPVTQYLLVLLVLIVIGGIIYFASRKK